MPYAVVDRVSFGPTAPWPLAAAGGGASLQRRDAAAYGNDPLNWKGEAPTAGRQNQKPVLTPTVITVQPASQSVSAGTDVTLSVIAAGTGPLSYQWRRDGLDVSGATNATFTLTNVQPAHQGSYLVRVSNSMGWAVSQTATLSVCVPPVITAQPRTLSVSVGSTANFSADATGTAPLTFQWYFNGEPISGATNKSHGIDSVQAADSGLYYAIATNCGGAATSQVAWLFVTGFDTDHDGIPDWWMLRYFGHLTGQAADHSLPDDDPDGDGLSNREEYAAGTDPNDAQSVLRFEAWQAAGSFAGIQFRFAAVAGVGYTLQYREGLGKGSWQKLLDLPAEATTREVRIPLPLMPGATPKFYRLVTPVQP